MRQFVDSLLFCGKLHRFPIWTQSAIAYMHFTLLTHSIFFSFSLSGLVFNCQIDKMVTPAMFLCVLSYYFLIAGEDFLLVFVHLAKF